MKPFGPSAFSEGMSFTTTSISCSVKGASKSSRSWCSYPNSLQLIALVLVVVVPNRFEKCVCASMDLFSCETTRLVSPLSAPINVFFLLMLACNWKKRVFVSPLRIQVSLECCRALAFCIAAIPSAFVLRYFLNSNSSGVRISFHFLGKASH